jgi:hypothetical protein
MFTLTMIGNPYAQKAAFLIFNADGTYSYR